MKNAISLHSKTQKIGTKPELKYDVSEIQVYVCTYPMRR